MSIDLNFRPEHYADFDDPVALALNGIKGQMRREMVRDMLTAEGDKREAYDALLGPVDDEVLGERASDGFVQNLNLACGPSWLGGEYLPDLDGQEVEIARVVLASTLMDVFSLRARIVDGGYAYRMVDEYPEYGGYVVTPDRSARTLTLGELVGLLDGIQHTEADPTDHTFVEQWWWQQWNWGDAPEECTAFAWVESEQYPQLNEYYLDRAWTWRIDRTELCEACGLRFDPRHDHICPADRGGKG